VALVKNRVLATVGDKEWIPYAKWYGSAPAVNMLRAFGCMVVFHVPKEKRGKLEASGRWGVHLGIAKDHKGWLLWDLTTQKLTVSRDIEEDEIAHCYWAPIPEPKTREEALNGPNGEKWKASEDEEFGSLIENETWDLCDLPPGKKAITSKMIYRHKYGPEGELTRYKSRLVARGFQQTKGKDYDEVFAPVGKGTTLRVLLAIAALLGWKIRQMDIEVVWLRRLLEELGVGQEEPTVVFCDNESAVKLAKNACLHGLTKHIRPKWHWVRRLLDKEVRLEIVKTHQQAADIFTKRLAEADHWKGMKLAGMMVNAHKVALCKAQVHKVKVHKVTPILGYLLDEVKPPGKIKYVAAASGALLPVIGVGNAKVKGANGELVGLGNVLLVKGLSANLLSTREEALNGPNGEKWKASEDEEFGSLIENETWDLCDLPPGKKAITSKMIYRHKYGPEGELTRYKSRLVARGFQQTKGRTMMSAEQMLEMQFKCSKMGEVKYYLGMHVERDVEKGVLRLHQRKYCEGLAEKFA
ncbi:hypothetical protein CLOP_g22355, partial [Closterium sp. NIES-67]